jgi:hypothetical protein
MNVDSGWQPMRALASSPALRIELGEPICKGNLQRCATAQPAPLVEVVAELLF